MNTEKILGTGWQEIVSDLIKSCFKEKMEQKLETTGQEKKHELEKDTNSKKKEGNVLHIEQCQRKDLFCFIKGSPEESLPCKERRSR